MYYEYRLTIASLAARGSPATLQVALSPGRLVAVAVQFPRGCVGLVHTRAIRSDHQLYPSNIDGDVSAEGASVTWAEDLVLDDDPYLLRLEGWSDDDTYAHTLSWRFNVLPMAAVRADRERRELEDRLRRLALSPSP